MACNCVIGLSGTLSTVSTVQSGSLAGTRLFSFTKTEDYTFNLDPIRVPSKYPNKKYFKGPKVGQLSGNPLGKNPGDVWIFPNVKNNHVEKTIHPCQFPIELVERLVLSMTNKGDIVFDPYMGVGSTIVGAIKHHRTGYGCDSQQKFVDVAWDRVHQLRAGNLKTRPMDRPVYDPKKPYGGQRRQLDIFS